MDQPPHVALCIPTFRRNDRLRACLNAVAGLRLPAGCTRTVIVADNDADGGARSLCEELRQRELPGLVYVIEAQRGLSHVRNRLLEEALRGDAGYIALLDDDEQPCADWLSAHLGALAAGADVSCGPVLHDDAGTAVEAQPAAGTAPRFVACNNVVFRRRLPEQQRLRFDPQFNFSGGEDFDFFEASRRLGNRHVWTPAALVFEPDTPERATIAYLFRRHCTGAMTRVMQERKWRPGPGVWPHFLIKLCGKILGGVACLLHALLPPRRAALRDAVKRFASACGYLCGLLRLRVERYR